MMIPVHRTMHSPRRWAIDLAMILVAGLFIYTFRLGDSPLDRTEPHRALVAHQMVQSGNWLIPHLFGEVYLRKPPLIYWIEGVTELLIGHGNEFVWRLPSAIGSALLAVLLAGWAGRWFGSAARLPTGIAALAVVALWEQDRGADIDALNTVAAVITACILLEFHFNEPRGFFAWLWATALAVAIGSVLLLKGPGAFPLILGALVGPPIVLHTWNTLRRPALWFGLLSGIAAFVIYAVIARAHLRHDGIPPDNAGAHEALQRMLLHHWRDVLPVLTTPVIVLLYSLPVSLAIPLCFRCQSPYRPRAMAIVATVGIALLIYLLAGNRNPRYEYVAVPLLALLVGAVAADFSKPKTLPRTLLIIFTILFAGLTIGLAAVIHRHSTHPQSLLLATVLAAIVGITTIYCLRQARFRSSAIALLLLLMLLSIPVGDRKNIERRKKSAKNTADQLREIVGDGGTVGVASMVRDMPELFYYSNLNVRAFGELHLDNLAAASGGQWVVLSENPRFPEYSAILADIPGAFPDGVTQLAMPDPRDRVFVGWYNPPPGVPRIARLMPRSTDSESNGED